MCVFFFFNTCVYVSLLGKSLLKKPEDAHLPPELRRAGLMAHMHIPKGKCFGPFNGRIVNKEKSPDKMHFFVSEVGFSLIANYST